MLQYVFDKPIPVEELDAELQSFARLVAAEGYDTISRMIVFVQPTLGCEPFGYRWRGSDVPITRVTFESRLAGKDPSEARRRSSREQYPDDGEAQAR